MKKQTLTEQTSRIKKMMGLNEAEVDLNTYKEESPILEDIKRVGTSSDGKPIISMVVNAFIPNIGTNNRDYNQGQSVKIKVTTEWNVYTKTHYGIPRTTFLIKKFVNIDSNVPLSDNVVHSIKMIFRENIELEDLLETIYRPYFAKFPNDIEYRQKIYNNFKRDMEMVERALLSDKSHQEEIPQETEPKKDNTPIEEPKNKNSTWTSTTSWASE